MQVRPATADDFPAYARLACDFHAASPMRGVCEFDHAGYETFFRGALGNDRLLLLLAESAGEIVGICGALLYPLYFAPSHMVAQELWWYLTPSARGGSAGKQMLGRIEQWAADSGAKSLFMIALANDRVETMERVYGRAGFSPMERTYMKEVG